VGQVEPRELDLLRVMHAELVEVPVVERRWSSYSSVQIECVMPSIESDWP